MRTAAIDSDKNKMWSTNGLSNAVRTGDASEVRLLIRKGANPDEWMRGPFAVDAGLTMLGVALVDGDVIMAQVLLEEGANPNALDIRGRNALMAACARGSAEGARWALQWCTPALFDKDEGSALSAAAGLIDDAELIRQLMNGSNPRALDGQGISALMRAALAKFDSNLGVLLPHSDPRALDGEKRSALHYACVMGRSYSEEKARCCAMLLAPHSDLNARDVGGARAEDCARETGYAQLGRELNGMRRSQAEAKKIAGVARAAPKNLSGRL